MTGEPLKNVAPLTTLLAPPRRQGDALRRVVSKRKKSMCIEELNGTIEGGWGGKRGRGREEGNEKCRQESNM